MAFINKNLKKNFLTPEKNQKKKQRKFFHFSTTTQTKATIKLTTITPNNNDHYLNATVKHTYE